MYLEYLGILSLFTAYFINFSVRTTNLFEHIFETISSYLLPYNMAYHFTRGYIKNEY